VKWGFSWPRSKHATGAKGRTYALSGGRGVCERSVAKSENGYIHRGKAREWGAGFAEAGAKRIEMTSLALKSEYVI